MDNKNRDEYLSLNKYEGRPKSDSHKDFASFAHEGEHYFALLRGGKPFLRSQGYSSAKGRDNGIASVTKNKDLEERWSVVEKKGKYYLSLKAGNNQEIGISGAYNSEADAKAALAGWMKGGSGSGAGAGAAGTAAAAAGIVGGGGNQSKDVLKEEDKEDDYLPTKEYEGKTVNDKKNNVALFKHENGQYYFAMYGKDGKVKLRSEGFETAKNRDVELAGVIKYHRDEKMYQTLERGKFYMMVLKDETGREVGRSPLLKKKAGAATAGKKDQKGQTKTTTTSKSSSMPAGASAAGIAASGIAGGRIISESSREVSRTEIGQKRNQIGESRNVIGEKRNVLGEKRNVIGEKRNTLSETKSKVKEDDYLKCEEYQGHKVTDATNRVAKFKGKDGQFYFAVYNKDGSVRLRSEGFKSDKGREDELKQVLSHKETEKMYKTIKKGKYYINVLNDKTGREVARSCMTKEVAALVAPVPVVVKKEPVVMAKKAEPVAVKRTPPPPPPKKVVPVAPVAQVAEKGGCFKWWMLLPLLLLLLIPLWLKFCAAPAAVVAPVAAPVVAPAAVPVAAPVVAPPPVVVAPTCDCSGLTHPVFKIPSGPAPKTTTRLGLAPEYGNISSLNAEGFYNKLKRGYDRSAKEKRFLDGIFMQMGYKNGFKDANASLFSSVTIPRGVSGNLGMKSNHQTVYRKLDPSNARDLQAFRVKAENTCDLHFMKTCGNHFFYKTCE